MPRIAFHLRIREGKRDEYREHHKNVPETLERAYLDCNAGLETYSVFEKEGHVFGYMEVDDPDTIRDVMENSEVQTDWGEVMDPILEDGGGDEDVWMDEVYRMA